MHIAGADTVLITRATDHLVLSFSFRINPNPCYPAHVRLATTLFDDGLANSPWNEFQNQSTYTSPWIYACYPNLLSFKSSSMYVNNWWVIPISCYNFFGHDSCNFAITNMRYLAKYNTCATLLREMNNLPAALEPKPAKLQIVGF